jgi:hypothetical protein
MFAWGVAAVVAVAPALSWTGVMTSPSRALADNETTCGSGLVMDQDILECVPITTTSGSSTASPDFAPSPDFTSAPSEMELTDENPGIGSAESHGGGR